MNKPFARRSYDGNQSSRMINSRGAVLLLVLWTVTLLTIFALAIGTAIRQKMILVSRLSSRGEMVGLLRSGFQKARAYFMLNEDLQGQPFSRVNGKQLCFNNPPAFQGILPEGGFAVQYNNYDLGADQPRIMFGLEDEERKLNINTAEEEELQRLFILAGGIKPEPAQDLAQAVIDWRTYGESEIVGFYGDAYYSNLKHPYEPKDAPFEVLEEVLLVKGMNPDRFARLKPFMTVYGSGRVNINTVSRPVLLALGMSPAVTDKIVLGRKGADGLEATRDDFIFRSSEGASININGFVDLRAEELAELDSLFVGGKITTESTVYTAHVQAMLERSDENRGLECIFRAKDAKILRWQML